MFVANVFASTNVFVVEFLYESSRRYGE